MQVKILLGDYNYLWIENCIDWTCDHCWKKHLKYQSILKKQNNDLFKIGTTCYKKLLSGNDLEKIKSNWIDKIINNDIKISKLLNNVIENINDFAIVRTEEPLKYAIQTKKDFELWNRDNYIWFSDIEYFTNKQLIIKIYNAFNV